MSLSSYQLSNWITFSPNYTKWNIFLSHSFMTLVREDWVQKIILEQWQQFYRGIKVLSRYSILDLNILIFSFKSLFSSPICTLVACRSFNLSLFYVLTVLHFISLQIFGIFIMVKDSCTLILVWYITKGLYLTHLTNMDPP